LQFNSNDIKKLGEKVEKKLEKWIKFFHFIPSFLKNRNFISFFSKSTPQKVKILHKKIKILIHYDL